MIIGEVQGNIQCTDRLDIRSQGSLTGDVITHRISVEDGAILKGGVQIRAVEKTAAGGGSAPDALATRENYWRERRDECEQVSKEIRELAGLIWGEQAVFRRMSELSDKIWSDEFWSGLRKLDVAPRDILGTIDSLIPPALGRPITKQPLAVKALQSKLARNLTWPQVTRQFCDCGKPPHDLGCKDRLKKEVKAVQKILSKYGLDYRTPQQRQS